MRGQANQANQANQAAEENQASSVEANAPLLIGEQKNGRGFSFTRSACPSAAYFPLAFSPRPRLNRLAAGVASIVYLRPVSLIPNMDPEKPRAELADDVKQRSLSMTGDPDADQKLARRILFKLDTR